MKPILTADVRVFYAAKSGTYTTRDRRFTGVAGGLDIGVSATWKWSSDPFFFNKRHIPVSKPPTSQFSHPGACVVLFVVRRWCEIEMACLVVLSPLICDLLVPFPLLHRRSSWRSAWVGATWQFLGDFCRQRWRTCGIGWQNPCLGT